MRTEAILPYLSPYQYVSSHKGSNSLRAPALQMASKKVGTFKLCEQFWFCPPMLAMYCEQTFLGCRVFTCCRPGLAWNSMSVLFYLKELKIIMIRTIENTILSLDPKGPKICYNNASEPIANFSNSFYAH